MKAYYLAEVVGILLGDGSLNVYESSKYSTYYRLKITTHSQDYEYIEYISELFIKLFNNKPIVRKRPEENTKDICIYKKSIVKYFLDLGMMKSPKWNRAIIPLQFMRQKYGKLILRGYFDTDGSVVLAKNHGRTYPRLEMKISPSPMQKQLEQLIRNYKFRFKTYRIGLGKVRIQINGLKELQKWEKIIGFSNPKHSEKMKKAMNAHKPLGLEVSV